MKATTESKPLTIKLGAYLYEKAKDGMSDIHRIIEISKIQGLGIKDRVLNREASMIHMRMNLDERQAFVENGVVPTRISKY